MFRVFSAGEKHFLRSFRASSGRTARKPMKTHSTLFVALLTLATTTTIVRAQATPNAGSSGLLGQRFAQAGVGLVDPHGTSDNGFAGDLGVNLPLQTGLDLGLAYNYNRINTDLGSAPLNIRSRDHSLFAGLTAYNTYEGWKPFFGAGLGYEWTRTKFRFAGTPVFTDRDDEAIWALGVGVEIPVGAITFTPSIGYQDGFKSRSTGVFGYGVEAHTWFTRKIGGFADVTYSDPTGGGTQSLTYRIGARLRF
jgi:opacity protein-like surface antigen